MVKNQKTWSTHQLPQSELAAAGEQIKSELNCSERAGGGVALMAIPALFHILNKANRITFAYPILSFRTTRYVG